MTYRLLRTATATVLLVAATQAAPAAADSLVFIKDHDVWLSSPDGSGQYRVTTDGTATNPYRSPSQTDDGVIVTMRDKPNGAPLLMLRQNGESIGSIPVGAVQAGPMDPHVAPDGRHVAFGIVRAAYVNGWLETATDVRTVRVADGAEVGQTGTRASTPSWLDANTVLAGRGPVAEYDTTDLTSTGWWSDYDHYSLFEHGEDLRDGEYAAGRVVFVRGEGDGKTMQVYRAGRGTSASPVPTCTFSDPTPGPLGRRYVDPTFSPDGTRMAWQEGDGIWTVSHPNVDDCAITPVLTIPGASEPDWSPAAVAPAPRTSAPGQTGGTDAPTGSGAPSPTGSQAPVGGSGAQVGPRCGDELEPRAKGVVVEVSGAGSGKAVAQLKVGGKTVGRASVKIGAKGEATVRVKLTTSARRTVRGRANATLTVTLPSGPAQQLKLRLR